MVAIMFRNRWYFLFVATFSIIHGILYLSSDINITLWDHPNSTNKNASESPDRKLVANNFQLKRSTTSKEFFACTYCSSMKPKIKNAGIESMIVDFFNFIIREVIDALEFLLKPIWKIVKKIIKLLLKKLFKHEMERLPAVRVGEKVVHGVEKAPEEIHKLGDEVKKIKVEPIKIGHIHI